MREAIYGGNPYAWSDQSQHPTRDVQKKKKKFTIIKKTVCEA